MIIDNGCCPFCLSEVGGGLRQDKKGRPYFTCNSCGTRAFIRITQVLNTFKWILSSGINYERARLLAENMPKTRELEAVGHG